MQAVLLDNNSPSISSPFPREDGSGTPYAPGTCSFHLDEWQNCADDSKNLFAKITLYDNNKAVIGQTNVDRATNPRGDPINDSDPLHFKSKLPYDIVITGEHKNNYVQFDYDGTNSHFTSRTTDGPAKCSNGGWDPRDGPICSLRFGNRDAVSTYHTWCG